MSCRIKGGGHDWQGVSFIQLTHTHQKLTAKVLSGSCTQLECLARLRYAGAGIFDPTAPQAFLALPCCRRRIHHDENIFHTRSRSK